MKFQPLGKIGAAKNIQNEFGRLFTDDIIVTDERITHIKNNHPADYSFFTAHVREAVNNPDVVIKDGKNDNTVFMIKKLEKTNLNVVVKVVVDSANPEYKNSVITFYRLRDRNLKKLAEKRNNKVLYKKE